MALYLLVSATIVIVMNIYLQFAPLESQRPGFGTFAILLVAPVILAWLLATLSLSVAGGITLLCGRKFGIELSVTGLVFMTVTLPLSITMFYSLIGDDVITNYYRDPTNFAIRDYVFPFFSYSSLAVSLAMFPLLILGHKRVKWQ